MIERTAKRISDIFMQDWDTWEISAMARFVVTLLPTRAYSRISHFCKEVLSHLP